MIRLFGKFKFRLLSLFILVSLIITGCGSDFASPYSASVLASEMAGRGFTADLKAESFASDLCVITENIPVEGLELSTQVESYLLIDVNNRTALAAYDVNRQIHPASTTKLMTALVALENCSMDEKIVLGEEVTGFAYDETVLPGKVGDVMTMDQALHFMLMYSANDIANSIAVHVAGSIPNFCNMMNEKAAADHALCLWTDDLYLPV